MVEETIRHNTSRTMKMPSTYDALRMTNAPMLLLVYQQ